MVEMAGVWFRVKSDSVSWIHNQSRAVATTLCGRTYLLYLNFEINRIQHPYILLGGSRKRTGEWKTLYNHV